MRSTSATAPRSIDLSGETPPARTGDGNVYRSRWRAGPQQARAALHRALAEIEAIASETPDAGGARVLWRRLARGRWSLVAEFELAGRRYYLMNEDRFAPKKRDALTRRERQVFQLVELGVSNKSIAYSLGISTSTVSTLLHGARKKIRRSFEMELASRFERELRKPKENRSIDGETRALRTPAVGQWCR